MRFVCDKCKTKYTIADDKVRGKVLKVRCKTCSNVIEVREPDAAPAPEPAVPERPSTALKALSRHAGTAARYRPPAGLATEAEPPRSEPAAERFPRRPPTGEQLALRKPATEPHLRDLRGNEPAADRAGRGSLFPDEAGRAPGRKQAVPPSAAAARPGGAPRRPAVEEEEDEGAGEKTQIAELPAEMLRRLQEPRAEAADDAPVWYLGDERGEYGPMAFSELAARCQRGEPGPAAEAWREGFPDWLPLAEIPALRPYVKVAPPPRPTQQPLPVSPFQKRPDGGAAGLKAGRASKSAAPLPETDELFQRDAPAPVAVGPTRRAAEPAVSRPSAPVAVARPVPAATPLPAAVAAPEPAAPEAPLPALASGPAADPFAAGGVPLGGLVEAPAVLSPLVLEEKRTRGKLLLLGGGVLLLLSVLIGLAVFWMATNRRNGGQKAPERHAEAPMAAPEMAPEMPPEMPPEMAPDMADEPAGTQELPELDIDVTPGMATGGAATLRNGTPAPRPRDMTGPEPGRPITGTPVRDDPDTSPMFQALMGFGDPGRSGSSGTSSGGGRPNDLGSVVRRNYTSLKRCYEKAAMLDSRLKNVRLRVSVVLSSEGQVRTVSISPDKHQSDAVGTCVRRAIGTWKFPSHASGYDYSFGANFIGS